MYSEAVSGHFSIYLGLGVSGHGTCRHSLHCFALFRKVWRDPPWFKARDVSSVFKFQFNIRQTTCTLFVVPFCVFESEVGIRDLSGSIVISSDQLGMLFRAHFRHPCGPAWDLKFGTFEPTIWNQVPCNGFGFPGPGPDHLQIQALAWIWHCQDP